MSNEVYLLDVEFDDAKAKIEKLLSQVDEGEFDEELAAAGIVRKPDIKLASGAQFSQGQGLSTDQWMQVLVEFVPLVATIATGVWEIIIVPKLKKRFREERVSDKDPRKKAKK